MMSVCYFQGWFSVVGGGGGGGVVVVVVEKNHCETFGKLIPIAVTGKNSKYTKMIKYDCIRDMVFA